MRRILLIAGALVLVVAAIAFLKRDDIASRILRGSDVSLMGEAAQASPQAKIAVDFLSALRARDTEKISRLATADQLARFKEEIQAAPAADSEPMSAMMLKDLPEDPVTLQGKIKSVQTHANRAVVLFETQANSWFIQLEQAGDTWKVSGF